MSAVRHDPRRRPELHPLPGLLALAALTGLVLWALVLQHRPGVPKNEYRPRYLDPNQATLAQFEGLPGIGPSKARAIVAYRRQARPPAFRTIEDLLRVPGIGPATLQRIQPYLAISPIVPHEGPPFPRPPQGQSPHS